MVCRNCIYYVLWLLLLIDTCANAQTDNPTLLKQQAQKALKAYTEDSALLRLLDDDCYFCRTLKCMTQEADCDDFVGETLKGIAPLVLGNDCKPCAPREKEIFDIIKKYISQNFPVEWSKILKLNT